MLDEHADQLGPTVLTAAPVTSAGSLFSGNERIAVIGLDSSKPRSSDITALLEKYEGIVRVIGRVWQILESVYRAIRTTAMAA